MKKYAVILILAIFVVPSIAFASWWNPFSWNWKALFSEKKSETTADVSKSNKEANSENVKNITITDQSEPNIANTVANFYDDIISATDTGLDLLNLLSTDTNRYIQGIPPYVSSAKGVINTTYNSAQASEINILLDNWGNGHVANFVKMKKNIDTYSNEVKKQQKAMSEVSKELRTKYIPKSQNDFYVNEVNSYSKKIMDQVDAYKDAQFSMTGQFLSEKKEIGDAIIQASLNDLQGKLNSIESLPARSHTSYVPPVPAFKPPIQTYCTNYGTSISCSSYSY